MLALESVFSVINPNCVSGSMTSRMLLETWQEVAFRESFHELGSTSDLYGLSRIFAWSVTWRVLQVPAMFTDLEKSAKFILVCLIIYLIMCSHWSNCSRIPSKLTVKSRISIFLTRSCYSSFSRRSAQAPARTDDFQDVSKISLGLLFPKKSVLQLVELCNADDLSKILTASLLKIPI